MKKIIKDTLILFAITLIAGILLGWVYSATKEPIEKQNRLKKETAYKAVFQKYYTLTEADTQADAADGLKFEELDPDSIDKFDDSFRARLGSNTANTLDEIVSAYDADGGLVGYVITVTNSEGYGGDIQMSVGIFEDGTVAGVEILSISETPGLGMNAKKDSFKDQFTGVNTTQFSFTKNGSQSPDEIDAISSATYTTKAMTNGVNAALSAFAALGDCNWQGGVQ